MVGGHLDSVIEGPGINDNGSGSAAILEIAEQMEQVKPSNTVRFAWWGAEESASSARTFYVDSLAAAELDRIALYLNFDMIGSPNYVRFVYDGDGDSARPVGTAPPSRERLQRVLRREQGSPPSRRRSTVGRTTRHSSTTGSRRRPVHGRRGDQDRGAGGRVRGQGRCALRPVLPPGLRHVREQQLRRARPDVGREPKPNNHVPQKNTARKRKPRRELQLARQDQRTGGEIGRERQAGRALSPARRSWVVFPPFARASTRSRMSLTRSPCPDEPSFPLVVPGRAPFAMRSRAQVAQAMYSRSYRRPHSRASDAQKGMPPAAVPCSRTLPFVVGERSLEVVEPLDDAPRARRRSRRLPRRPRGARGEDTEDRLVPHGSVGRGPSATAEPRRGRRP